MSYIFIIMFHGQGFRDEDFIFGPRSWVSWRMGRHGRVTQWEQLKSAQSLLAPLLFTITPPGGQSITLCSLSRSLEFWLEFDTAAHRFCGLCANEIPDMWLRRTTACGTATDEQGGVNACAVHTCAH